MKKLTIFKILLLSLSVSSFAYAQTASILPPAKTTFLDNNGKPLTSGKVYFYTPNTLTAKTTWQNSSESVTNTNPVILDAAGRALIYGDGTYRQIVKDRNDVVIWDQVTSSTGSGGGGGSTATGDGDLVGTIKPWAGMTAPNQYAFTYGQEVSRTTYATLFTAITSAQSIFCTSASPTLTGLGDTTNFWIGMSVEVSCLAAGFSTVISKTATTVTLAANANVTTNVTATFFPWGRGNGSTTFNLPDFRGVPIAGNNNMGGTPSSNLTTTYFGSTDPNSIGAFGGNQSATLVTGNLPAQTPAGTIVSTFTASSGGQNIMQDTGGPISSNASGGDNRQMSASAVSTTITGTVSSAFTGTAFAGQVSTPFSRVMPVRTSNYIIKTTPDTNSATASGVTSLGSMTGDIACGTGVLCTGNTISALSSSIVVDSTTVTGGTNNGLFYNNGGLFGNSSIIQQPSVSSVPFLGVGNAIATAMAGQLTTKPSVLWVSRLVNWTNINDQTINDQSTLSPIDSVSNQYASYASNLSITTNFNYNHIAAFEDLNRYHGGGTMTEWWSFLSNPTHDGLGTVTNRRGVNIQEVISTGTITNNYGLYVAALTKGVTSNWGLYIDGTTQSFMGGSLTIGSLSPVANTSKAIIIRGADSGATGGSTIAGVNGASANWQVGNTSAIDGGGYDATMYFKSATSAYRFGGLTAGLLTSSSNGSVSVTSMGTGVATALGVNTGSAGSFVVNGGALGTPSSGTATNLTGTASGLTAGSVTTNANLTGPITSSGNATAIASQTGTGTKFVVDNTPTLITPILGVATATSINGSTVSPGQYSGTTTNDSASTGNIGQIIESYIPFASSVALTSVTTANVTSISVTAGQWNICGQLAYKPNAATTSTAFVAAISAVSATLPTPGTQAGTAYAQSVGSYSAGTSPVFVTGCVYAKLSGTTTYYLLAFANFAVNTMDAYGGIWATRVR